MLSFSRRLELHLLAATPALLTALLAILYLAPKYIENLNTVLPLLPLMPMFYWGLSHARAMPYWFAFLIGLATDAVSGLPLGFTSLLYMLFLALLHTQRRFMHKEGFIVKWGCFGGLLLAVMVASGLLLSWFAGESPLLLPAFIQWCLSVACYPLAHVVFDAIDQQLHDRRWQILHGR